MPRQPDSFFRPPHCCLLPCRYVHYSYTVQYIHTYRVTTLFWKRRLHIFPAYHRENVSNRITIAKMSEIVWKMSYFFIYCKFLKGLGIRLSVFERTTFFVSERGKLRFARFFERIAILLFSKERWERTAHSSSFVKSNGSKSLKLLFKKRLWAKRDVSDSYKKGEKLSKANKKC